jgi:hypothetical protein
MNKPIFEPPSERDFLLVQLLPDDHRRVRDFMRENSVTVADAVQMLGIGRPDGGPLPEGSEVTVEEREFLLKQLSWNDRALVEEAIAQHPEWTIVQCIADPSGTPLICGPLGFRGSVERSNH